MKTFSGFVIDEIGHMLSGCFYNLVKLYPFREKVTAFAIESFVSATFIWTIGMAESNGYSIVFYQCLIAKKFFAVVNCHSLNWAGESEINPEKPSKTALCDKPSSLVIANKRVARSATVKRIAFVPRPLRIVSIFKCPVSALRLVNSLRSSIEVPTNGHSET
ncbi:hypothetical protein [Lacticaseibacillus paracasei]|uniref:hypothetical protein n=1 Tax=Lacticaseibacillus paracasei TaxID=1597 RepID=UPI00192C7309|nr:hypothetical protein [Lacticaseibacillus paracasei]QXJ69442.1 hypothetical protein J5Y16_14255 [Lacticaseibacillus paracasei subsp. paracasei]